MKQIGKALIGSALGRAVINMAKGLIMAGVMVGSERIPK